jgi:UDP-N-acetylmuramyl pentapeptide synthase
MKARFRRLVASLFEHQVRRVIKRHHLKVVAVAGSVGKTSTKSAIATVLSQKYRVLSGHRNYNSEIGLPLSVFELTVPSSLLNPIAWAYKLAQSEYRLRNYPYEVLVLELGTDHVGEIPLYLRYLRPEVGVVTAVTPEHMEGFPGGLDEVAAEELALAAASKTIVINDHDVAAAYQKQHLADHPHVVRYGPKADIHWAGRGNLCLGERTAATDPPVIGDHMLSVALAAAAVGDLFKLSDHQIAEGVAAIRPVPGRMNPLSGAEGTTLIDDTYNSSPEAAVAALEALAAYPATGRRIAILGSMNELGPDSPRYHAEVGAAAAGVDWLITIGAQANDHLGPAAVKAGLDPSRFKPADSPYAAGRFVRTMLAAGDVVLIKGSQNRVFAEEATRQLLADPSDASKLVRQSPEWQRIKRQQFSDADTKD